VRVAFHTELDDLIDDLATMTRLAGQMMSNASAALHQADLALAEWVIASDDEMDTLHAHTEQRCVKLIALQAPVAADLRTVIAALHAGNDLQRMGNLAQHIAKIARRNHPTRAIPGTVRPVFARMNLLATQLAEDAATALDKRDPLSGDRLDQTDDEMDDLRRHLFRIMYADDWSHGVEAAVDAALLGRYYERFADHAVAIARQVCYLATGHATDAAS
jgi:phosphate transport system protein